ncbi:MAG: hypothetical protein F6K31_04665 [Symploca sp. SIO2G7]|nr:hypothetical protein [Symploca sp. SIO2G7]
MKKTLPPNLKIDAVTRRRGDTETGRFSCMAVKKFFHWELPPALFF